jgi:hypothetical protein
MTVLNSHIFCIDCHAPYLGVRKHKAPRCRPCWLKWKRNQSKRHCIGCGIGLPYKFWKRGKSETPRCLKCQGNHIGGHVHVTV